MSNIYFHYKNTAFKIEDEAKITAWIASVFQNFKKTFEELNYIFCDDEYMLGINKQFLNHDTFTDIITFSNHEEKESIDSDIFISIERVKENAKEFNQSFEQELKRVMIHGALHLIGFNDKTKEEQKQMTEKEDYSLSLYYN